MLNRTTVSDMFTDCGQIECKSLTEPQAFEPEAFEEPSEN